MGLGDEIMALGRAEAAFERHGRPVAICNDIGQPRDYAAWHGNPAWDKNSTVKIIDGAGCRPYHQGPLHGKGIWVLDHKPRAGRIWLTDAEKRFAKQAISATVGSARFAVVGSPIKEYASVNKEWGSENWEAVISKMPITVLQLLPTPQTRVLKGAIGVHTHTFRQAAAIIAHAALVMCNEGGNHHMAASLGVPAVVVFGAFIPPSVTGYDFHRNIAIDTPEGFCGNFSECQHCKNAMAQITPEMVLENVKQMLEKC